MMRRTAVLLVSLAAVCGCSDEDAGLERASLGIAASDLAGRHAVVACEELPLLQGSRRYTTHVIDDRLTIRVMAEPSNVTLRFEDDGKTLSAPRIVPRGALLRSWAEDMDVVLYDGDTYTLSLSGGCTP